MPRRFTPFFPGVTLGWRTRQKGEFDHELAWLAVSLAAVGTGIAWLNAGLPQPACPFRTLTQCACPTCGTTRVVWAIARGDFAGALFLNPLVMGAAAGTVLFDLYAATVLILRLPRLRIETVTPGAARRVRLAVCGAFVLNWTWLVWVGI